MEIHLWTDEVLAKAHQIEELGHLRKEGSLIIDALDGDGVFLAFLPRMADEFSLVEKGHQKVTLSLHVHTYPVR